MAPIWTNTGSGWHLLAPTGFPDEAALQSLVEQAPQILPLAGSPQLAIVGREVLLGNGYADLIAIEPTGRLAVIEVKLARNSEARRAIVAQILTYAAYLSGLDLGVLEREVLGNHLRERGLADLAGAAAAGDQVGAFESAQFVEGLTNCLAEGRFRLVLVLDEAPEELVRLVGYLESVTADKLLIDLITVASYRIGDSEVIVPQRVEAEHWSPAAIPRHPAAASTGRIVDGVDDFDASIAAVEDKKRPALERLRNWAVSLRDEGLVYLKTYHGRRQNCWTLLPRLHHENVGLVTIYNDGGRASITPFRSVFERLAPKSIPAVEGLIAPAQLKQGSAVYSISDELLLALTDAYREAAGRTTSK